jgi:hypothetical protein
MHPLDELPVSRVKAWNYPFHIYHLKLGRVKKGFMPRNEFLGFFNNRVYMRIPPSFNS